MGTKNKFILSLLVSAIVMLTTAATILKRKDTYKKITKANNTCDCYSTSPLYKIPINFNNSDFFA